MGQFTDTLRATLRDLAQSDARLYRGLQQELGETSPPSQVARSWSGYRWQRFGASARAGASRV